MRHPENASFSFSVELSCSSSRLVVISAYSLSYAENSSVVSAGATNIWAATQDEFMQSEMGNIFKLARYGHEIQDAGLDNVEYLQNQAKVTLM